MGIAQDGSGNIAVQIDGSNNSVTVTHGQARLTLLQRHKRRRQPRKHLDLLDPYSRAIELVGRGDDLAALAAWLEDPAPIKVRCLTGRAGSGKTRLALELCVRAEGSGWLAGFVAYDELVAFQQRQHLAGWRWPQPTLIVVDYAAASARVLRSWLEQLAEHQGKEAPRLRLLLLERYASAEAGWWVELTRFGGFASGGLADLIGAPMALPSLRTLEQRRQVLGSVMVAASELDGIDPPLRPPAPGADPYFEARLGDDLIDNEPLYLMMAGLTAVRSRVPHVLANGREDLARALAQAEIERIGRLARDRGLDGTFLQHLAACATLIDGITCDAAEALTLEEQQALQLPPVDGASVAAALADALQGPTMDLIEAIRPDLIGEATIMVAFELARRSPERQARIVARAWRRAPAKTVATVIRTAQDYAPADGNHPTLVWLQHLAGLTDDPLELMAIVGEVPLATTSLCALAVEIQSRIVDILRADTAVSENSRPRLAMSLNNLANRLSALGWREPALQTAEEAVQLYRELAAVRSDAFRPDLAGSLNNLAIMLSDLGRREPALQAAEEAVQLYRKLAEDRSDAFRPDLAGSLNNLANRLSNLGRREPALQAAEEAVQLYRKLAEDRPDAFRAGLASSLIILAVVLSDLGRREPALQAAEEAVQFYRELAAARPDAFRPDLAGSLNNLANRLSSLGRREAALQAAEETVAIRRKLAAARPDAFQPDLAGSLNNLANRLSDLGRRELALQAAEEAVAIRRELAAARPDAFRPDLAGSLNNLANRLSDLGRREPALQVAEEAVQLYRELATARPDAFRSDLAMSLNNLAIMLSDLGRREPALQAGEEAVQLYRELAAAQPDAFRPNLAGSLNNLANRLSNLGRREPALQAAEEAVQFYRKLAEDRPHAFRPNLAVSLAVVANCLENCDRQVDALAVNREAITLLAPAFLGLPEAFVHWMLPMVRQYLECCKANGSEPDRALLEPLLRVLKRYEPSTEGGREEGES